MLSLRHFALLLCFVLPLSAQWRIGLSSVKITPEQRVPLAGYASRTNAFTGVEHDIWAQGLALEDDSGNRALLITAEICVLSPTVAEPICEELVQKTGLKREQILLSVSHTHSGPWVNLQPRAGDIPASLTNNIVEYTRVFQKKLAEAGLEAFNRRSPARLSFSSGVANFVMNRRETTTNGVILGVNPRGIVDRSVPVLRVDSPEGELRAILYGYACHGTTLPSDALIVSGDYPSYAREELRKKFPNAEVFFIAGLAGSANPYPRTGLNFAKAHGEELAREIIRVLGGRSRPLNGPLKCLMENADLPLRALSREEIEAALNNRRQSWMRGAAQQMLAKLDRGEKLPAIHKAPIAVWQFGSDLTLVALSGEVVGEFIPLIERSIGPLDLWLAAYCNAVSGYIPTAAVLDEGGYECRGLYEGVGLYSRDAQDIYVAKISELANRAGRKPAN